MTFKELNTMIFDVHDKVRAIQTFSTLFNEAVIHMGNLETQRERLPAIDDISALSLALANYADEAANRLLESLPATVEGITP